MKWITAGDIKSWIDCNSRHCQETMPELVRRLILAHTINTVEEINFPSGDSIVTGGLDGFLKTQVVSPFFPTGVSGWEIGTEKSAQAKAEADYTKRTENPLGLTPAASTFVFVTPRTWPGGEKWQNEKRATGIWKGVRVINADRLEQWLDSTPAVALWLARQIGKVVSSDIRDLEAVWEEWAVGTKPLMTPDLVIGGRTRELEAMQGWIGGNPRILEVQGDHPEETMAFLYASIAKLPDPQKAQAVARCVVVETITALRQLTQAFQNYPLIIAAPGECINAAHAAVEKKHHVFISMDATVIVKSNVLRLSRPQYSVVEKVLHESGLSEAEAQRDARDSGRSIPVLRRHLFQSHGVSAPAWAKAESAEILLPVLFANAWDERRDGDREVIGLLSGKSYDDFIRAVTPFLFMDDSPIRNVGDVWMIKSPLDAWFPLAQHITQAQLGLFRQSLVAVLTKTDPKYELEVEKRFAASIYGKSNPYSEYIQTGLVESLVLLAVYGNRSPRFAPTQAFADHVVKEIFTAADSWEAWASIKSATPLLAEAAPDTFLEVVDQVTSKNPTVFQELMKDDSEGIFSECKHSGLLWALEGIAWSSDYFARAVNVLADLTNIDPGGKWCNRPINSLGDIFYPGLPQTHVNPKDRLEVLGMLVRENPQLVWKFTHRYLGGGTISESHSFRWRDTGGVRRGGEPETNEEYREYLMGLQPMLRDLACLRENLIESLEKFTQLPAYIREELLGTLEHIDIAALSNAEQGQIFHHTRHALSWINSYDDEGMRQYGPELPALNRILGKFTPSDVIERVGWLLSSPWPELPQGRHNKKFEANEKAIKKAQKDAARELLDKVPINKVIEFGCSIEYPQVLGHCLAIAIHNETESNYVFDAMLKYSTEMPWLIRGYVSGRIEVVGINWIDDQIKRLESIGVFSPKVCSLLFLSLPEDSETWSKVSIHGKDVEIEYWKQVTVYSIRNKDDAQFAVEKLLDVKRPDAALCIAGAHDVSIPSTLLQRLLHDLLNMKEQKIHNSRMELYHIGYVFDQLYKRNELTIDEIARLEWPFAEFFDDLKRYISSPFAMHRILQKDPQLFAQLVCFLYKREDNGPAPESEGISEEPLKMRAHAAYKVLDSWHTIPGQKDDGSVDETELVDWIEMARKKCAESKHLTVCDIHIGMLLAYTPADPDGTWPHVAVRNLIETLNNETIDQHIQMGVRNSRGVTSRAHNEGGRQERELVEKYRAMINTLKIRWPRTAVLLRGIAESYEYDAKREDIRADLDDLR